MTKPVTAVAAMILKERGILDFEEPVSKYFPEYEYLRIWGKSGKQKVSLKIRNLLNMDSGIVYPGPKNVQKDGVAIRIVGRYSGRDYSGNFTNESGGIFEKGDICSVGNGRYKFLCTNRETRAFC